MADKRRKTKKILSLLSGAARGLLILTSLLFLVILNIWTSRGDEVEALDMDLRKWYVERHEKTLGEITPLLRSDPDEAALRLEELAEDMGLVRSQDRRKELYGKVLTSLLEARRATGDSDGALEAAGRLVALEGNHHRYQREYGRELVNRGREAEAIEHLYRAFRLRPDIVEGVELLAKTLYGEGRGVEARKVIKKYEKTLMVSYGRLLYSSFNEPFSAERSSTIIPLLFSGEPLDLWFPVGVHGVVFLGFDIPNIEGLRADIEGFTIVTTGGEVELDIEEAVVETSNLKRLTGGRFIVTSTKTPYLTLKVPGEVTSEITDGVSVRVAYHPPMTQGLYDILKRTEGGYAPSPGEGGGAI